MESEEEGGWPVGSGQRRGVESEAGGWTVRQKGVESEIEGDGEWAEGGWRVRQRGGAEGGG